jgi:hypothetical protein
VSVPKPLHVSYFPLGAISFIYSLSFFDVAELNRMLIKVIPAKTTIMLGILLPETLPQKISSVPIARLKSAHITLSNGDDSPLAGGLANGVGNLSPETPCTKWGTKLVKKAPAKKHAT